MAATEFWSRPDRFGVLARYALMDRVKAAAETANALRGRLARHVGAARPYSADLIGRLALQLYLVKDGIKDALEDAPVELALTIEPLFEGGDRDATLAWCRRLTEMYRAWAAKRRMHIEDLRPAREGKDGKDVNVPILLVSGFGAHRTLAREAGLHVFEPSDESPGRVTCRVRLAVVPLSDVPAAKEARLVLQALERAARMTAVVRRYREDPPLVRDAAGQWRTGRLDLVLGGEFRR
jgi:hypothetical protein